MWSHSPLSSYSVWERDDGAPSWYSCVPRAQARVCCTVGVSICGMDREVFRLGKAGGVDEDLAAKLEAYTNLWWMLHGIEVRGLLLHPPPPFSPQQVCRKGVVTWICSYFLIKVLQAASGEESPSSSLRRFLSHLPAASRGQVGSLPECTVLRSGGSSRPCTAPSGHAPQFLWATVDVRE